MHQIVVDVSTEYHCGSKGMEAAMNGYAHNKVMYPISLHFEMILVSHSFGCIVATITGGPGASPQKDIGSKNAR